MRRVFVAAAGVALLGATIYRAPTWLETWNVGVVVGIVVCAAGVLVLAIGFALLASAAAIKRAALELACMGAALVAAEVILLMRAPEKWLSDPVAQRLVRRERAAHANGIEYDSRLRTEVVRDLRARGVDAVPGFAQSMMTSTAVAPALEASGLFPLSNVSNALVVECNEGPGYLRFHSDELGFNNPPGLVGGPIDVAVIGESLALGHCVPPSKSAVDRLRARFPRTANFGVAGARVLSQLGVFREYVEPLAPRFVVWFVNVNFAVAQEEAEQPTLLRYLREPDFRQRLRERQHELDALLREVTVPFEVRRDEQLRRKLEEADRFPFVRAAKLREVRNLMDFGPVTRRRSPTPNVSHFEQALGLVTRTTASWGGEVIVVVLPSYPLAIDSPADFARHEAVMQVVSRSDVTVVDGAALFASQPDVLDLFTLRGDNHPNERGHALLAKAIAKAIGSRAEP